MKPVKQNIDFTALFDFATEGILVVNSEGLITMANGAVCKMFGYELEELIDQPIEILIPESLKTRHTGHRTDYNKKPHPRSMGLGIDLFARNKKGNNFPVEISLSPFDSNGKKLVIAFIIDITQRKEIEDAVINQKMQLERIATELKTSNEVLEAKVNDRTKILLEALNALEKSKRELSEALVKEKELNELKSRFLSMASHEFRTPLTTILSSVSLIEDYKDLSHQEKRMRHVNRIKSAVNNLNDILSDFISISRIEEGKVIADLGRFNLKKLAEEVVHEINLLLKTGQTINFNHTGNEHVIMDPKMTRNVLINLISNAIKFSGENSPIDLVTYVDDDEIYIEVKDYGIGISNEDKKHLFERFFRGHNAGNIPGTGLGLNIVGNYAELMGGRITFQSELNSGTAFKLRFSKAEIEKRLNQ